MADRKVLVGDVDSLTGIVAHGSFDAGDTLVDPTGAPLVEITPAWYYGTGQDGDVTITSNTTLNANVMYNNLTIAPGVVVTLNGYVLMVKDTLTLGNGARISRDGNNGSGGTGGANLNPFIYAGSGIGGNSSAAGGSSNNSFGGSGGKGGNSGATVGGNGGTAGLVTEANGGSVNKASLHTLTTGLLISNTGRTGGGSGGGGGAVTSGTGGGGGSGGGVGVVFANKIVVSGTASITANGGNGANGTTNAGGGGGGGGGFVAVVSSYPQPAGLTLTANGGLGGNGAGANGQAGTAGSPGTTVFHVWKETKATA